MSSIAVLIADPNWFYLNPWNICPRFQVLVLIDYSFRFFKNFILTSWINELSSDWSGNYRHHRQRWALGFPFFWSTKILKRFKAVLLHSWSFLGRQKLQIFFFTTVASTRSIYQCFCILYTRLLYLLQVFTISFLFLQIRCGCRTCISWFFMSPLDVVIFLLHCLFQIEDIYTWCSRFKLRELFASFKHGMV